MIEKSQWIKNASKHISFKQIYLDVFVGACIIAGGHVNVEVNYDFALITMYTLEVIA